MQNILVTGADGFIGSRFCSILSSNKKYTVVGTIFNKSMKKHELPQNIKVEICDLTSIETFSILEKYKPVKIYHFAAQAIVKESQTNPFFTLHNNIMSTLMLLEGTKRYCKDIELFYYHSTDKVFGNKEQAKEEDKYVVTDPYSASKISSEILCQAYRNVYNLPIAIGRSCNVYGPKDFNSRVIPNTIKDIILNSQAIIYDQDKYMYRQYIYVDDLCNIIQSIKSGKKTFYNISPVSKESIINTENLVLLIIDIAKALFDIKVKIIRKKKEKILEIQSQSLCTSFKNYPYTDLSQGLIYTFLWYKDFLYNKKL